MPARSSSSFFLFKVTYVGDRLPHPVLPQLRKERGHPPRPPAGDGGEQVRVRTAELVGGRRQLRAEPSGPLFTVAAPASLLEDPLAFLFGLVASLVRIPRLRRLGERRSRGGCLRRPQIPPQFLQICHHRVEFRDLPLA